MGLMEMGRRLSKTARSSYPVRILSATVAVLLLLIGIVRLWPAHEVSERERVIEMDTSPFLIEEIVQTSQIAGSPPPPPPPIPVTSPIDFLVEVPDLEFDISLPEDPSDRDSGTDLTGTNAYSAAPERRETARPVRFVEPTYSLEASRQGILAEVDARLHIDHRGHVVEVQLINRYVVDRESGKRQMVDEIGYGLDEAALDAARRWVFRPADLDGQPVESVYTVTFTFGD